MFIGKTNLGFLVAEHREHDSGGLTYRCREERRFLGEGIRGLTGDHISPLSELSPLGHVIDPGGTPREGGLYLFLSYGAIDRVCCDFISIDIG